MAYTTGLGTVKDPKAFFTPLATPLGNSLAGAAFYSLLPIPPWLGFGIHLSFPNCRLGAKLDESVRAAILSEGLLLYP